VLAPAVDPSWLPSLELTIARHHKLLSEIAPNAFTPKIHFVTHYPRLLLSYGPLRHLWAMRFEAMHQYFKQLVRKTRNYINVTATLSERFQRKKCYELATNSFMLSATTVDCAQRLLKLQRLPSRLKALLMEQFCLKGNLEILSVKSVVVNGHIDVALVVWLFMTLCMLKTYLSFYWSRTFCILIKSGVFVAHCISQRNLIPVFMHTVWKTVTNGWLWKPVTHGTHSI
jgi:hypothetical protein